MKYKPTTKQELKELVDNLEINLGDIDTSLITNMENLFELSTRTDFSGIENWNVSNVTDMNGMFYGCYNFNQPIGNWDVSNVTDMSQMFKGCVNFNQDISRWDVSKVTNMSEMFSFCWNFNQPLDKWNVSNVEDVWRMFYDAEAFTQDLSSWLKKNKNIRFYEMFDSKKYDLYRDKDRQIGIRLRITGEYI